MHRFVFCGFKLVQLFFFSGPTRVGRLPPFKCSPCVLVPALPLGHPSEFFKRGFICTATKEDAVALPQRDVHLGGPDVMALVRISSIGLPPEYCKMLMRCLDEDALTSSALQICICIFFFFSPAVNVFLHASQLLNISALR